jgi:hypothetical protein
MNYAELQQAILDDTHKSQYVGAPVQRFIAQGEELIDAHLESYNFLAQLTDANRVSAGSSNYNLPSRLTHLRYVRIDGRPLDKVDESSVYLSRNASMPIVYAQRASQIIFAGTPGTATAIDIDYMGMPARLTDIAPTNTLLDNQSQLYIDAASVFVYRRAQDYESAKIAFDNVLLMCKELNRKSKKLLGGAQAAGAYNVGFRSSY